MSLAFGDPPVGVRAEGAELFLARDPESGLDLVGVGEAAAVVPCAGRLLGSLTLDRAERRGLDSLREELLVDLGARPPRGATPIEEVGAEAVIVDVAAIDQPIDDPGDPAADRFAVFPGPITALVELAPEGLDQSPPRLVRARQRAKGFVLEPGLVEGQGVPALAPARGAVGRAGLGGVGGESRWPVRFHGLHATKSAKRPRGVPSGLRRGPAPPMPELPEVETTRRRIAPLLVGRRIARVVTSPPSYFFITPPDELRAHLEGRSVESLDRVGKYLVMGLDRGDRVLLHLGMTGQLFSSEATSVRLLSATARASLDPDEQRRFEPDEHTHLRFEMEGEGPAVYFRDVRKFGKVQWLPVGEANARLDRLGTDALEVSGEDLFQANRGRRVAIKAMLLDQSVAAGVGNIYADEALFLAGVRPGRAAKRVTRRECDAIAAGLHRVLHRSIETGGSSISDYVAPDGSDGGYQDERRVYGRTGEPCRECGEPIRRRVVAQRSSHYCSRCQR